ncbi:YchJ family protein [Falsarthrobacter nasiphocae]|uniref:SEC-C motif-containing protein n=1 Tax=Falsarthrobacter nasiphocae TaxID=189863 RepID=A0AAE4C503_9MICC|nr:YchJ family metal-binding protein [Falsarthrobacter nasiphocae]MDR6891846.1 SEC-C motif-containing protein [Falsarthrobacter nasiphocae]
MSRPASPDVPGAAGRSLSEAPATAEALMRARYAAFARGDSAFLASTWHPSTRPADVGADDGTQWRGLRVLDTVRGGEGDDDGLVEFIAAYRLDGVRGEMRERSRFVREDGQWLYVDGVHLDPLTGAPLDLATGEPLDPATDAPLG